MNTAIKEYLQGSDKYQNFLSTLKQNIKFETYLINQLQDEKIQDQEVQDQKNSRLQYFRDLFQRYIYHEQEAIEYDFNTKVINWIIMMCILLFFLGVPVYEVLSFDSLICTCIGMALLTMMDLYLSINTNQVVEDLKYLLFLLCLINITFVATTITLDIDRINKDKSREKNEIFLTFTLILITIMVWLGYYLTHQNELRHTFVAIDPNKYLPGLSIYIILMIGALILQNVDDDMKFSPTNFKKSKSHRMGKAMSIFALNSFVVYYFAEFEYFCSPIWTVFFCVLHYIFCGGFTFLLSIAIFVDQNKLLGSFFILLNSFIYGRVIWSQYI